MNLHLPPDSGSVHLHFHDDATISVYRPGEVPDPPAANLMGGTRRFPRWLALGLVGSLCLALGYTVGARGPASSAQFASLPRPALARPDLGYIPASPTALPAAKQPKPDLPNGTAVERYVPRPGGEVPPAVAEQLAQPPVVTPAPTLPRPAQGASAVGLEN